ncbi:tRNA lysidine(34) synthetase TilS, partial [Planctomycetota bacterium]
MYDDFLTHIAAKGLFPPGKAFNIGFSGGIDSSVLLHLLISINEEEQMGWEITAAHFNHQIRETAAADESFCRKQAEKAAISYRSAAGDVPAFCAKKGVSLETGARMCRFGFFSSLKGPVVLAHHQNDQIETVIHNIIRGTGLKGLAGMRQIAEIEGQTIVRPLLGFTKQQIEEYAGQKAVPFVQDPSNSDTAFTRNRLRHQVIPLLAEINPGFERHLAALATSAGRAWQLLSTDPGLRDCIGLENGDIIELNTGRLRELAPSLQAIVLFLALEKLGIDISRRAVDKALELLSRPVQGTVCVELAGGGQIRREYDRLLLLRRAPQVRAAVRAELTVPGECRMPGADQVLTAEIGEAMPELLETIQSNADPMTAYLDRDLVPDDILTVRTRETSDRFHPLGAPGATKLQDFLVDVKCPRGERDRVLLVTSQKDIAWVTGYRSSERFKVTANTSR